MDKIQSTIPVEAWSDDDHSLITRVQIVTGKYQNKFTAVGSLTVWYNGVPSKSRGVCKNLVHTQRHAIELRPNETITSMKVYSNLIHKFVSGISISTSTGRNLGPFGVASRVVTHLKSPYQNGYYISSLKGTSGDILTDLQANFACTYGSPFARGLTDSALESNFNSNSTTSTISSRGSAGYHTDEDQYLTSKSLMVNNHQLQYELHNRLHGLPDTPMKVSDLSGTGSLLKASKPPPPPRTTGLKSLRTGSHHIPIKSLSRNGSKSSLLTNRPIMAKSTTYSSV